LPDWKKRWNEVMQKATHSIPSMRAYFVQQVGLVGFMPNSDTIQDCIKIFYLWLFHRVHVTVVSQLKSPTATEPGEDPTKNCKKVLETWINTFLKNMQIWLGGDKKSGAQSKFIENMARFNNDPKVKKYFNLIKSLYDGIIDDMRDACAEIAKNQNYKQCIEVALKKIEEYQKNAHGKIFAVIEKKLS
jgi:hypothetical protein